MSPTIRILGFAGSLRKASFNKALLRAAQELLPSDAELETFDLEGIPLFNQDLEQQPVERVKLWKERIRAADAILICTPEYNYSIPGVLKNALDCASRPYGDNAFDGKPVAVMGASVGTLGSARAQYHLRQSFVFLNMHPMNMPEIMVPTAQDKFDANGKLTDENVRKRVAEYLQKFIAHVQRVNRK